MSLNKITACLWFDNQAEEAANFYTAIFKNSSIKHIQRFTESGQEFHGKTPGSVMVVAFDLNGHPFVALNGGPQFKFNEAVSFQITCEDQEEVDYFWEKLGEGGDVKKQQCGWLADKFGLSWQIIPKQLFQMMSDSDTAKAKRASDAMFTMKKIDVAELKKAFDG